MSFLARLLARGRAVTSIFGTIAEQNIKFLYLEIGFAAIQSAIIMFHGPFAVRLGASKELVALLSSIPALISALFAIPSARFLEQRQNRRRWMFGALLLIRIGHGAVALIPLLFPVDTATWLVVWVILLNVPLMLFTNGFQALLADLIPERKRGQVFARRQIIWSVGMVITSIGAGAWLSHVEFPVNYQLMYIFGFITVLGSHFYLNKLAVPRQYLRHTVQAPQIPVVKTRVRLTPPIRRMLMNQFVYQFGLTMAGPMFSVYLIESLNASDAWIGLNGAVNYIGVIFGNALWAYLLRSHSYTWVLRRATLFTWMFPVGIALVPDLTFILFVGLIVNIMHPGVELGGLNVMLKLSSPQERTVVMSWYNTVVNFSLFIAPLVGVFLASYITIPGVFILAGIIRTVGGLLFTFNPVQEPPREAGVLDTATS